jgi:hypothetical protein
MRCGNQFLGIGADAFFEPAGEGLLSLLKYLRLGAQMSFPFFS